MATVESYRVLVLGDFHYGDNYTTGGAAMLDEYGYSHSTTKLKTFIDASDSFILNLETPLVDPESTPSPFSGKKQYTHWSDPDKTAKELQKLGVDAVGLANNHTVDHGVVGLEKTLAVLDDARIGWFGAGRNLGEATAPYQVRLPERVGGGEIHFHASFQYKKGYDAAFESYATEQSPGCAPLGVSTVPGARHDSTREDAFQVAFPHWGPNYDWRSRGQYQLAHRFLNKDYDLVLGHGGHAMQEVHRKQQRWVVYGIGNGMFNSGGRWRRYEEENRILPFSFWAMLEVHRENSGRRWLTLKLYPVYSDNRDTNYQPGPVTAEDFDRVIEVLETRPIRPWRFANHAQRAACDDLGHHLALDLGEWNQGARPSRLAPACEGGDPGDWPLRSPDSDIEDQVLGLDRSMSASMLAIPAEAEGARVRWFGRLGLVECRDKRLFVFDYRAHESSLGSSIVKDKVLTAEFLEASGISTPKTFLVNSPNDAVKKASEMSSAVVVKPRDGRKSRGVSTGLVKPAAIREAFDYASKYGTEIIIQEHIEVDEELRVMASPDRAVAVIRRVLPHVIGDGVSSIRQLVEDKNQQRELNPSLRKRPIPVDELANRQLESNGYTLEDVPELGQQVTVRGVAGLSVGADAFQALEVTGPEVKNAAIAAVGAIPGMGWGGADLIIEKHTGRPYVIEINNQAAYGGALFPTFGQPLNVGAEVWKLRFAATSAESETVPQVSGPHKKAKPFIRAAASVDDADSIGFEDLFEESLRRQNFTIERRNPRILKVTDPAGGEIWVTRSGLTANDRSVVQKVMQNHEWICRVLDVAKVPRPRSKKVSSPDELAHFVKGRLSSAILMPASARWEGSSAHWVTEHEALGVKSLPHRMWVQARLRGRRLRVLATRDKAWVVTANATQRLVDENHLEDASRLAVEAVRAVPELRWAAVDILVRPTFLNEGRANGLLVEGLSTGPQYSVDDRIVAGDFDAFIRTLTGIAPHEERGRGQPRIEEDEGGPNRRRWFRRIW